MNSLLLEKFTKLDKDEKQSTIKELLKDSSLRKLEIELGIPRSTLQDWSSGRQNNNGNEIHISIDTMIKKLDGYKPKLTEFPKLEKLRSIINDIMALKYK